MTALIITGGGHPSPALLNRLKSRVDLVIAADSGLETSFAAGIEPDYAIGDFDSLGDIALLDRLPPDRVSRFPRDKDNTDTELALAFARSKGAGECLVAGAGGGRFDHLLAMWYLFRGANPPSEWHTDSDSAFYLRQESSLVCTMEAGSTVSVFPIGESGTGMRSEGLKWSLEGLEWRPGDCGISNVSILPKVKIFSGTSALLVVAPLGTERLS